LQQIATIGNGSYQHSKNVEGLRLIYQNISYEILTKIAQQNQSIATLVNVTHSELFDDSIIQYTYNPLIDEITPGTISVTQQLPLTNCSSTISIPPGIILMDAKVSSYSGPHWADLLVINDETIFNLSNYYVPYYRLGDPFIIQAPITLLASGINTIFVETGDSATNRTGCSANNSFIYTALVPAVTARTDVKERLEGCVWTVRFEDGDTAQITIPVEYNGTKTCSYQPGNITYDEEDTYDLAVYTLFKQLDLNDQGEVFVNINKLDLEISTTAISGIPYLWGPAIVRIESWQ
jgi:hypothetical protein